MIGTITDEKDYGASDHLESHFMSRSILPAIATDPSVGSKLRILSPMNILSQNALDVARSGTPTGDTFDNVFSPMISQLKSKGDGKAAKGRNNFGQPNQLQKGITQGNPRKKSDFMFSPVSNKKKVAGFQNKAKYSRLEEKKNTHSRKNSRIVISQNKK